MGSFTFFFFANSYLLAYPAQHAKKEVQFRETSILYEVIVSPKMPTKNFPDFCPERVGQKSGKFFGWHFGRNDDLINHKFILNLIDL